MKNVVIPLKKEEIYRDVALNSAYIGAKSGLDAAYYHRVATMEDDIEILEGFYAEMCGVVSERLRELIVKSETSGTGVEITLELSGSYDETQNDSIKRELSSAMASGICARWLGISSPQLSEEWTKKTENFLERVLSRLYHRRKPIRK